MSKISIRAKLYVIFALFMTPAIYLIYSLIATQNIAINATSFELQGSRYLAALRDVHYVIIGLAAGKSPPGEIVQRAEATWGTGLDSAAMASRLVGALGKDDEARAALHDLMSRVGDTSGLILDPDLDSFYVMDSVVVNIPDLADRVYTIARLTAGIAAKDTLPGDDRTDYLIAKGGLQTAAANLQSDYEHAARGNADGSIKARLEAPYAKAGETMRALLRAADAAVLQKTGKTDAAAVSTIGRDALVVLRDLNVAAAADLDRLLNRRIDGLMHDRMVKLGITAALFFVIFSLGGYYVAQAVVWPVEGMTMAMTRLAEGDQTAAIPGKERHDEIGQMAKAVVVFKDNMIRTREMVAEQARMKDDAEAGRRDHLHTVSQRLEHRTTELKQTVGMSSQQFQTVAQSLSASAGQTESRASAMAATTGQALANVETAVIATRQLSQSIHDIGRQVEHSAQAAEMASAEAKRTDVTVRSLSESSTRIGEVVKLINNIASQTNLLALNATIEAARAGEAGRGFAVVANEVKSLANQTATATDEIARQVAAVQASTHDAVLAIAAISARISDVHQSAATISGAVEEQSAATAEIARNVEQASEGTREVSNAIESVISVTRETTNLARQILELTEARNQNAGAFFSQVLEMARSLRDEA
jgi:methyl-accepting chemotaxis protein